MYKKFWILTQESYTGNETSDNCEAKIVAPLYESKYVPMKNKLLNIAYSWKINVTKTNFSLARLLKRGL